MAAISRTPPVEGRPAGVRCPGKTGCATHSAASLTLTQCMVRPCVARDFRRSVGFGSRINVSGLILERALRAIMDISARALLLAARPQLGHSGHQGSHAREDRPPSRLNLSQTSAGKQAVTDLEMKFSVLNF
jgi:hypothetical protein